MRAHLEIGSIVAAMLVAQALVSVAATSDAQAPQPANSPAQAESGGRIGELLKMLDARVSPEVIKVFIETSPIAVNVSAGDVIALKNHGATDDITTALLKRGAQARARAADAVARVSASGFRGAAPAPMGLDPEGYDYFQYYYLFPRTLAAAYGQLGYGGAPAFGYGYSPFSGLGFSSRFGHPRWFGFRTVQPTR